MEAHRRHARLAQRPGQAGREWTQSQSNLQAIQPNARNHREHLPGLHGVVGGGIRKRVLKHCADAKMAQGRRNYSVPTIAFSAVDAAATEVLESVLVYDPANRASPAFCLTFEYFDIIRDPNTKLANGQRIPVSASMLNMKSVSSQLTLSDECML